jgi:hypothetical protein
VATKHAKMGDRLGSGRTSLKGTSSSRGHVQLIRTVLPLVAKRSRMCAEPSCLLVATKPAKMDELPASQASLHLEHSLLQARVLKIPIAPQLVVSRARTCAEHCFLSAVEKRAKTDEHLANQVPSHRALSSSLGLAFPIQTVRPLVAKRTRMSAGLSSL